MSDSSANMSAAPPALPAHPPFPVARLLWAFGFGILAWLTFWLVLVLGLVQFVMVAINGRVHEELKSFSLNLIQYLWELLAYVTFVRDEQPFPIGAFPNGCKTAA